MIPGDRADQQTGEDARERDETGEGGTSPTLVME
jgi:hypothetical protein